MSQQISRNSSPTIHLRDIPTPVGGIARLDVTFKQGNKIVLQKSFDDVVVDRKKRMISFGLTADETNLFVANKNVHVQLTALFSNGTQIPFMETTMYVTDVLNNNNF